MRIIRPKTIIIHDNLLNKIHFVINCFSDEKINNYSRYYHQQIQNIKNLKILTLNNKFQKKIKKSTNKKLKVTSNISKKKFKTMVSQAKKYIKIGDIFLVVLSQRFESTLIK